MVLAAETSAQPNDGFPARRLKTEAGFSGSGLWVLGSGV